MRKNRPDGSALVDAWKHPIGSLVQVRRDNGDIEYRATATDPYIMGDNTAVIMLRGISGCYALDRCTFLCLPDKIDKWVEEGNEELCVRVDADQFGEHNYPGEPDHTSDCEFGCGCWAGPSRSGGPINPFGRCNKNPITPQARIMELKENLCTARKLIEELREENRNIKQNVGGGI